MGSALRRAVLGVPFKSKEGGNGWSPQISVMACSNLNPQFKLKGTLNLFPFHWFPRMPQRCKMGSWLQPLCDSTAQEAAARSLNPADLVLCLADLGHLAAYLIHVPLGCCIDRGWEPSLPGLSALLLLSETFSPASSVQLQKELLSGAVRQWNPDLVSQMPYCHPAGEVSAWQLLAEGCTLLRNV